ncbi:hypothetical protein COCNU_scaffold000135G000020 [Cocos nucifera]|nr:hypothetical protein [Cocos nucifera]
MRRRFRRRSSGAHGQDGQDLERGRYRSGPFLLLWWESHRIEVASTPAVASRQQPNQIDGDGWWNAGAGARAAENQLDVHGSGDGASRSGDGTQSRAGEVAQGLYSSS